MAMEGGNVGSRVLVVDDEPLARSRLRGLLAQCVPAPTAVGEADGADAMWQQLAQGWDVVLLDIHMPGMDGLSLAQRLRTLPLPPAVVFVTAHAEHAVQAFELEAVDYLTKPVRLERLQQALGKARRWLGARSVADPASGHTAAPDFLLIHDRGRTERVWLDDVVYLKAELKYVTVRTAERSHIYDGSLHELEHRHPQRWLRIHRNALVARSRVVAVLKQPAESADADAWVVQLHGVPERLPVSRRQLNMVREAVAHG